MKNVQIGDGGFKDHERVSSNIIFGKNTEFDSSTVDCFEINDFGIVYVRHCTLTFLGTKQEWDDYVDTNCKKNIHWKDAWNRVKDKIEVNCVKIPTESESESDSEEVE